MIPANTSTTSAPRDHGEPTHDQPAEGEQSEVVVIFRRRKTRTRPRSTRRLLDRLLDLVKAILS